MNHFIIQANNWKLYYKHSCILIVSYRPSCIYRLSVWWIHDVRFGGRVAYFSYLDFNSIFTPWQIQLKFIHKQAIHGHHNLAFRILMFMYEYIVTSLLTGKRSVVIYNDVNWYFYCNQYIYWLLKVYKLLLYMLILLYVY